MRHARLLITSAVVLFAFGSVGCSLQIEKTFAVQDGSGFNMNFVTYDEPPVEVPGPRLTLGGGTVMTIDVSVDLLDYLDGTMNGDVTIGDLLFTATGLSLFGFDLGPMCIGLSGPSGGSFEYQVLNQTAAFDVVVDTAAVLLNKANMAYIGTAKTIPFPFHMQAEMPLGLVEALGLFAGTSEMTVTQDIDQQIVFGSGPRPMRVHMTGTVTLQTQDAFPTNTLIEQCLVAVST